MESMPSTHKKIDGAVQTYFSLNGLRGLCRVKTCFRGAMRLVDSSLRHHAAGAAAKTISYLLFAGALKGCALKRKNRLFDDVLVHLYFLQEPRSSQWVWPRKLP